MDPHEVIIRPVISEKSYGLMERGQYCFVVHPNATKPEIRRAVETLFGVKVRRVNTLWRKGKVKRHRLYTGKRADQKRAIVTLAPGQTIEVFEKG